MRRKVSLGYNDCWGELWNFSKNSLRERLELAVAWFLRKVTILESLKRHGS